MLRHQYADLFEVRDANWKNDEKNLNVSALFLFLPLYLGRIVLLRAGCIHSRLYYEQGLLNSKDTSIFHCAYLSEVRSSLMLSILIYNSTFF